MKKMTRTVRKKIRSKKGMTLVEILVGVTIVVIVFASTLGAMVTGYTTTLFNADENRSAVLNSSVNEIVLNTVRKARISDGDAALEMIDAMANYDPESATGSDTVGAAVMAAVATQVPEAVFVQPQDDGMGGYTADFSEGESYQFTILPEKQSSLSFIEAGKDDLVITGMTIKTCFESAKGSITYEAFIPYAK